MTLRIHLAIGSPELRRRVAALLRADAEVLLVAEPERAELVVGEGPDTGVAELAGTMILPALTSRETDVLRLMAQGLGNKSIARELGISSHTAKYHVAAVLAKLGVHTRAEAVSRGIRRGLVPL
ncbi:MAG TPA: LuxR C-terminal-related transcriptional regulator [Gemmatimonadales bacterium]|nr:LuxR C-terminal-related transcriptional regulator [Gemmatimonadales bacterium]